MARDQLALMSQVAHFTNTAAQLREHISAQADFAVDAIQQVRDEASAGAKNAGGEPRPETSTAASSSNQQTAGKPLESSNNVLGHYTVTCAYCDGEVPKVIAKQCPSRPLPCTLT